MSGTSTSIVPSSPQTEKNKALPHDLCSIAVSLSLNPKLVQSDLTQLSSNQAQYPNGMPEIPRTPSDEIDTAAIRSPGSAFR